MYQTIRYEKDGNIGILTIDRPEALNALNSTVIGELYQVIDEVENDSTLGCLIITGEGRSFVAGADIGEQCPMDLTAGRNWGRRGSALMRRIEKLEDPHHRRGERLCPGRRLRAGLGLRYHPGFREGQVRPAGSDPGHHPRFLRHPAPAPPCGRGQGQGARSSPAR